MVLEVDQAVLRRAGDRLIADLDPLEAIALDHLLGGAALDQAIGRAREHAGDRLRHEARDILELAARRHLLRVRKAEPIPGS